MGEVICFTVVLKLIGAISAYVKCCVVERQAPFYFLVAVKADNELFKEFTFSCHKKETATVHALFKVN